MDAIDCAINDAVFYITGQGKLSGEKWKIEISEAVQSLEEKNKSIRFILGKKVGKQMRIVPELRFFVDDSLDYIDKIDELLK